MSLITYFSIMLLFYSSKLSFLGFEVILDDIMTLDYCNRDLENSFIKEDGWFMYANFISMDNSSLRFTTDNYFDKSEITQISSKIENVTKTILKGIHAKAQLIEKVPRLNEILSQLNEDWHIYNGIMEEYNNKTYDLSLTVGTINNLAEKLCKLSNHNNQNCYQNYEKLRYHTLEDKLNDIADIPENKETLESLNEEIALNAAIKAFQILNDDINNILLNNQNNEIQELVRNFSKNVNVFDPLQNMVLQAFNEYIEHDKIIIKKIFTDNHIFGNIYANRPFTTYVKSKNQNEIINEPSKFEPNDITARVKFRLMISLDNFIDILYNYFSYSTEFIPEPVPQNDEFKEPEELINAATLLLTSKQHENYTGGAYQLLNQYTMNFKNLKKQLYNVYETFDIDSLNYIKTKNVEALFYLTLNYGLFLFEDLTKVKNATNQLEDLLTKLNEKVPFISRTPLSVLFNSLNAEGQKSYISFIETLCDVKYESKKFHSNKHRSTTLSICSKVKLTYNKVTNQNIEESEASPVVLRQGFSFLEWIESIIYPEDALENHITCSYPIDDQEVYVDKIAVLQNEMVSLNYMSDTNWHENICKIKNSIYNNQNISNQTVIELNAYLHNIVEARNLSSYINYHSNILLNIDNIRTTESSDEFVMHIEESNPSIIPKKKYEVI